MIDRYKEIFKKSLLELNFNRCICLTNKIFTYLLAGLPVILSKTPAQQELSHQLGEAAIVIDIDDPDAIAIVLDEWFSNPEKLHNARLVANKLGKDLYNWDLEQKKVFQILEYALSSRVKIGGITITKNKFFIKHKLKSLFKNNISKKQKYMPEKLTIKQKIGKWLIPKLPFNNHVFNHFRLELNAWVVRSLFPLNPFYILKLNKVRKSTNTLLNIGCGPFGKENWVNIDLFSHPNLTLRFDARMNLPLSNDSCQGIHVEHFFEHLNPSDEVPAFLNECYRCMQKDAVLRIIVPDLELYIRAYLADGWELLNTVGCGTDRPQEVFKTKMDALNHVFLQGWEHYGGYDSENLEIIIREAGFSHVKRTSWRNGDFPVECIDREQHRSYSLYFEAKK